MQPKLSSQTPVPRTDSNSREEIVQCILRHECAVTTSGRHFRLRGKRLWKQYRHRDIRAKREDETNSARKKRLGLVKANG